MARIKLDSPLDHIVVAASLRALGVRADIDAAVLARDLAGWTPRAVLTAAAFVLERTRAAGIDPEKHRMFLDCLSGEIRPLAERWLDESGAPTQVLLSEQCVSVATLVALGQSAPDGDPGHEPLVNRLVAASLAVHDVVGAGDLLLEVSRGMLYADHEDWADHLTIGHKIVELLCAPNRTIDFDACCRAACDVGFREAWMMTALFGMTVSRFGAGTGFMPWQLVGNPNGYDTATLAAGRRIWTQTPEQAAQRARADTTVLGWSFTALSERPIADDNDEHIVVWPRALEQKAHPFGVFAFAERVAERSGIAVPKVREASSPVLEELVAALLEGGYPHLREIVPEEGQRQRFGRDYRSQQSDWLLVEDKYVVALEARHRPFSYMAQAIGDLTDLENDIELSVVNKIQQCDAAIDNAYRDGMLNGRRAIAVVVNSCPVPVSPLLYQHIESRLEDRSITPFRDSQPADTRYPIAVVSAVNLHQLLRGSRRSQMSVGGIVARWRGHPQLGDGGFYNWAQQHFPKAVRSVEVDWMAVAARSVLGYDLTSSS